MLLHLLRQRPRPGAPRPEVKAWSYEARGPEGGQGDKNLASTTSLVLISGKQSKHYYKFTTILSFVLMSNDKNDKILQSVRVKTVY